MAPELSSGLAPAAVDTPPASPVGALLSPAALAALGPVAAGVPDALWRRALVDPVESILGRPGKGVRARLVEIAYALAGGRGSPPPALPAMLEILHAGSMIIDDIEDDSRERRGAPAVHRLFGVPLALNAGNWMYFAPFALAASLGLPARTELRLLRRFGQVLLDCHGGQGLDLGARVGSLPADRLGDVAATIARLKTGRLCALAAEAGAIVAGASAARTRALATFGEELGVGLQMLDDLGNLSPRVTPDKRYEDLRHGRVTYVWAFTAALAGARLPGLVATAERLRAEEQLSLASRRRPSPQRWTALAETLRGIADAHGRQQAHQHLCSALAALRARVGPDPRLALLEREIGRLEASYG